MKELKFEEIKKEDEEIQFDDHVEYKKHGKEEKMSPSKKVSMLDVSCVQEGDNVSADMESNLDFESYDQKQEFKKCYAYTSLTIISCITIAL